MTASTRTSPRLTERDVLRRLQQRYGTRVKNGQWEGQKFTRAEHVPLGLGFNRDRIADFIATSMHNNNDYKAKIHVQAPIFHGHEVKVSRSDWLTELANPAKSEAWRKHLHHWWLVVPDLSIVRDDLPDGWGLMVTHGTRLRAVVPAPLRTPQPMPHDMVGALLRATASTESRYALADAQADLPLRGTP